MNLITDKVRANAEKCRQCALQKIREIAEMKSKAEKSSILYKNTKIVADAFAKLSCNLCPYKKDFVKVYGMSPSEYFSRGDVEME